jgi:hypothetical protein
LGFAEYHDETAGKKDAAFFPKFLEKWGKAGPVGG